MEIVLEETKSQYFESFSLLDLDNIHETFKIFSSIKGPLEAKIFAVNESISSRQLSKIKNYFDKINICSLCIYSNNRDTILSGKSLKIDSAFIKEQEIKKKLLSLNSKKKDDILHKGPASTACGGGHSRGPGPSTARSRFGRTAAAGAVRTATPRFGATLCRSPCNPSCLTRVVQPCWLCRHGDAQHVGPQT